MFGNRAASYFNGVATPCQVAMCLVCLTVGEDKTKAGRRRGREKIINCWRSLRWASISIEGSHDDGVQSFGVFFYCLLQTLRRKKIPSRCFSKRAVSATGRRTSCFVPVGESKKIKLTGSGYPRSFCANAFRHVRHAHHVGRLSGHIS